VRNETGADLVVKHNAGTGNYKYFPAGTDLVLKNNEIVQFKFRLQQITLGFRLCRCSCKYRRCGKYQPYTTFKRIQKVWKH
jgi:hypothetical protein